MSRKNGSILHVGASFRAILIGTLLIPVNVHWVMLMNAFDQSYPTTVSLYFNVIFAVFLMVLISLFLRRFGDRWTLKQGEILTIYTMLAIATSISGCDFAIVLISIIPHVFWFATPENEWAELLPQIFPAGLPLKIVKLW